LHYTASGIIIPIGVMIRQNKCNLLVFFKKNIECKAHLHGEVFPVKLTLNQLVYVYSPFMKHALLRFCKQYVSSLCNIHLNSVEIHKYFDLHEEFKKKTGNLFGK